MKDITNDFYKFVSAVMPLWNLHFCKAGSRHDPDAADYFAEIEGYVFWAVVISSSKPGEPPRLPHTGRYPYDQPIKWIRVLPRRRDARLLLGRYDANGTKVWHKEIEFVQKEFRCLWIDFFDWDSYGCRNYEYLHCALIPSFEFEGETYHEALLRFQDAKIVFEEDSA